MNDVDCALTLLAISRDWRSAGKSAGDSDALHIERVNLAGMIFARNGAGFPSPSKLDIRQADVKDIYKLCYAAALEAGDGPDGKPHAAIASDVLFWSPDAKDPSKPDATLNLCWPFDQDSSLIRFSPAISDGTGPQPKRLYFYTKIASTVAAAEDGDAGGGLWPRPKAPTSSRKPLLKIDTPKQRRAIAALLGCVAIAILFSLCFDFVGEQLSAAVHGVVHNDGEHCNANSWPDDCATRWKAAWKASSGWLAAAVRPPFKWGAQVEGGVSLLSLFLSMVVSVTLLMIAAGLARRGRWDGILIDDRNRISLSRAQQAAWTTLLVSGLSSMALFNVAMLSAFGVPMDKTLEIFPTMPLELWAAMGINLIATPFLSSYILDKKSSEAEQTSVATSALYVRSLINPAPIDTNVSPTEASWVDLVAGETKGTDQQIDMSRVQYVIISGVLLTTYFLALAGYLSGIDGKSVVQAALGHTAVFAKMPDVGKTFLWLLGISHGGYLVFKAAAKAGGSENTGS